MAQYPDLLVQPVNADVLRAMIPTTLRKTDSLPARTNNTLAADPQLQAIPLGVGTWEVETLLFAFHTAAGTTTANFAVRWSFSGTATGHRACLGIASGSTSTTSAQMRSIGSALTTTQTFGVTDTFYHPVREKGIVVVTVAGNLAIDWAQGTTNANAVNLGTNSTVWWRRIE